VKERSVSVILLSGGQGKRMGVFFSSHAPNLGSMSGGCSEVYFLCVSCILFWVRFIHHFRGNAIAVFLMLMHILMVYQCTFASYE
jgi:hypothetical protein